MMCRSVTKHAKNKPTTIHRVELVSVYLFAVFLR